MPSRVGRAGRTGSTPALARREWDGTDDNGPACLAPAHDCAQPLAVRALRFAIRVLSAVADGTAAVTWQSVVVVLVLVTSVVLPILASQPKRKRGKGAAGKDKLKRKISTLRDAFADALRSLRTVPWCVPPGRPSLHGAPCSLPPLPPPGSRASRSFPAANSLSRLRAGPPRALRTARCRLGRASWRPWSRASARQLAHRTAPPSTSASRTRMSTSSARPSRPRASRG